MSSDPAALTLEDLIAIRPRHLRGPFPQGNRMPLGERPGRGRSQSLDFDGIGPFAPGDEARHIDWRATARSNEVQVRRFAAQSRLARMVVLDISDDIAFGTRIRPMAKTATLLAARLLWESLALNEPVGLVRPDAVAIAPRRGRNHVLRLLRILQDCHEDLAGTVAAPPEELMTAACGGLQRGDEIALIGEFALPLEPVIATGRARSEHWRMCAYIVADPMFGTPLPAGRYPGAQWCTRPSAGVRCRQSCRECGRVVGANPAP